MKKACKRLMQFDNYLLDILSIKIKNHFFDKIMPRITRSNDFGQVYIITAIILWKDNFANLLNVFLALAIGLLCGEGLLKYMLKRQRPLKTSIKCTSLIKSSKSFSFPSGHTTSSCAVLGVTWAMDLPYKYVILALAIVISFSRVYLRVHYPLDIIGGILLGFLCAMITIKLSEYTNINQFIVNCSLVNNNNLIHNGLAVKLLKFNIP